MGSKLTRNLVYWSVSLISPIGSQTTFIDFGGTKLPCTKKRLLSLLSSFPFVKISITGLELMISAGVACNRNFDGYGKELDCRQSVQRNRSTCNTEEQSVIVGRDRGAGDREKRGQEVYGRREKRGREAGLPR